MAYWYTIDGSDIDTVRHEDSELVENAELGQVGSGRIVVEDADGTIGIVGLKDVLVTEADCADPILSAGFVGPRTYRRMVERTDGAREIAVTVWDLNDLLGQRVITGTDGKRPAETVGERLTWLLASDYLAGLVIDNGRVVYPADKGMDKNIFRNSRPGDVLAACATAAAGMNYYVRDFGAGPELIFRNDNTSTADASTLRISNIEADVDTTTFPPFLDTTLTRDPSEVASQVTMSYAKLSVTDTRPATATAFAERHATADNSAIKTASKAHDEATDYLWQHHTETDLIQTSILLPPDSVNLVRAGDRIQAKFAHFASEGYDSFGWWRVLERRVKPLPKPAALYQVSLKLSPQEAAPPAAVIVQSAFGRSGEGGLNLSLANPVTVGNLLVFAIGDRAQPAPPAPNTAPTKPRWGAGAWTKIPNVTINSVGWNDGVAFWVKEADSTERTGYQGSTNANMGIYEIAVPDAAATIAAITSDYEDAPAVANPMSVGSLGTVASGAIALMVLVWADQKNWDDSGNPAATMADPWVIDWFRWAYDGPLIIQNSPYTVIAHAYGDGGALTGAVTRTGLLHLDGLWCAAAIVITPTA